MAPNAKPVEDEPLILPRAPQHRAPDVNRNFSLNLAMETLGLGSAYRSKTLTTKAAERQARLAQEEAMLDSIIVEKIKSKDWDALKPNSGKSMKIGSHNVCVRFRKDESSKVRVWEWHGHVMLYDDYEGYFPEYVYGYHFELVGNDDEVTLGRTVGLGSIITGVEITGTPKEM